MSRSHATSGDGRSRRAVVGAAGAALAATLGGCLEAVSRRVFEGNPYGPGDVVLINQDDGAHEVTVRAALDGDPVAERTASVPAAGRRTFEGFLSGTDRYRVAVSLDGERVATLGFRPETGDGGRSLSVRITGPSAVEWAIGSTD